MRRLLLFVSLALAFAWWITPNALAIKEIDPLIIAKPSTIDFGNIEQNGREVSADVIITNISKTTVELNRLSTSCGCTTAIMDLSPLQPGEARIMKVTFDPTVHPEETGELQRAVFLQTSDPNYPETTIDVTGMILPKPASKEVVVFFNEACSDCGELVKETYPGLFAKYGYTLTLRDYINEKENRKTLNEYNQKLNVPFELQSHIEAFVGDNLLIGGHVPLPIISYLLEHPEQYKKLLVYQDLMHGDATEYKVWNFQDEVLTYTIDEPITTYLDTLKANDGTVPTKSKFSNIRGFGPLFALITGSAFLDGLNPCAFAVLLFFIAFLFSIKRSRGSILKTGLIYILGIYIAYFLIGIGLAQAIIISGSPHLMAYIGSYLVIGLGVLQLLGVIFPRFPIKLRIPISTKAVVEKWVFKATIPAAFIAGFVVGLCTFPCSGGIYVAIIGMLSASQTYASGFLWMIWYNLIFVSPLFIMLAFAGNPRTTSYLQQLERKESMYAKIIIGVTMILVGLIILKFFI